jgi:hypothetical protein
MNGRQGVCSYYTLTISLHVGGVTTGVSAQRPKMGAIDTHRLSGGDWGW